MGVLQFCLILTISSVAYSSIPFRYNILEHNVVPIQGRAINFVPVSHNELLGYEYIQKSSIPPRMPHSEYGAPEENTIIFKTTTENLIPKEELPIKELEKPAEEYGPPKSSEESFHKVETPVETPSTTTEQIMTTTSAPKVFLPPGLPELPPPPMFNIDELKPEKENFEEFMKTEEIHKPAEEYGPPLEEHREFEISKEVKEEISKSTDETNLFVEEKKEFESPKTVLPPGLPELPPAPVFSVEDIPKQAEEFNLTAEKNEELEMAEEILPLPELPKETLVIEKEIRKPSIDYGLPSRENHHINFEVNIKANLHTYPYIDSPNVRQVKPNEVTFVSQLPLRPAIRAPDMPTTLITETSKESSELPLSPIVPDMKLAPYPPAMYTPSIMSELPRTEEMLDLSTLSQSEDMKYFMEKMPSAPYPPARPVIEIEKETVPSTAPPMIVFQKVKTYMPPSKPYMEGPYPPPLPYSKYGSR